MKNKTIIESSTGIEFELEILDLRHQKPSDVRIMLGQFHSELTDYTTQGGLFRLKENDTSRQTTENLLRIAELNTVDLLVLPELSVPQDTIELVRQWSERTGATVVCGSHYAETGEKHVNRCPIFVSGRVFQTDKINPAPSELSPIAGEGVSAGDKISVLLNSPVGNLAVTVCADYLDPKLKNQLPLDELDFLCVPALQRKSSTYHSRMSPDCNDRQDGIYIVYANMSISDASDGRSAVFGHIDRIYHDKLVQAGHTNASETFKLIEVESGARYFISDVSLDKKRPSINRTIHTRPNFSLVKAEALKSVTSSSFTQQIGRPDEAYERISKIFVEPREFDRIESLLEDEHFVFIVGDPGIGKTYTAVRLLKKYFDAGREVRWLSGLDQEERTLQRNILENLKPNKGEVIYFEDPFGRTEYENRDTLRNAFRPLIDSLATRDAKMIITSRKSIFEQFKEDAISADDLREFVTEMNIVNPSYDTDSLCEILERLSEPCAWRSTISSRELVTAAVRQGQFATPLAIRDFVRSSAQIDDHEDLLSRLSKREKEEKDQFAYEIAHSDFPTMLVLSLVLLFGSFSSRQLSDWFNKIATFMDSHTKWVGTSPLFRALRRQIGHRIEQQGKRAISFRFIHPYYEEALIQAYRNDLTVADVLNTSLTAVARENLYTALISVFRIAVRYPVASQLMIGQLRPLLRQNASSAELTYTVNRLTGLRIHTGDASYGETLLEIVTFDEFRQMTLDCDDMSEVSAMLRGLYNFGRIVGYQMTDGDEQVDGLFDRMLEHPSYSSLLDGFYFFCRLFRGYGGRLLKASCAKKHQRQVLNLQSLERERFVSIFYRCGYASGKRFATLQSSLRTTTIKRARLRRYDLASHATSGKEIIIDAGAELALKGGFASLLPVGVVGVVGTFGEGDVVTVLNEKRETVAHGVAGYSSQEIDKIKGQHSSLIGDIIGIYRQAAVVPRDRLLVKPDDESMGA